MNRPFLLKPAVAATASNPFLTKLLLQGFLHNKQAATPEVVNILKQPLTRKGYTAAVADWIPQLFNTPVNALSTQADNWRNLDIASAIIWGDKDTVTPLSQGRELQSLIKNSELIVLPEVGHIPQIEAPDLFRATLVKALHTMSKQQNESQ